MPIIDEKKQTAGRVGLAILKEGGTVALYNDDDVIFCIDCMFENHSHELATFWSLDADDIAKTEKIYICDECGKEIK